MNIKIDVICENINLKTTLQMDEQTKIREKNEM